MSLNNQKNFYHFVIVQLLCFLTQFLILAIFYREQKYVYLACLSIPSLVIIMILYYFIFWRPINNRINFYNLINLLLFVASIWIYFDTFYGIQNKTLDIQLQEVSQCQVIGQEFINLGGVESYSILYINFLYNNQQMLGYGCQSSLSKNRANYKISPNHFYFKRDKLACDHNYQNSDFTLHSQNSQSNQYQSQQLQKPSQLVSTQEQQNNLCYNYYLFSEVKLPSWLCMSSDIPFQDMIETQNCYLNFYGDKTAAYKNSLDRNVLRHVQDFALITYNRIPIPKWTYQPLLILDLNMLIISLNSFYFYIVLFFKQTIFYLLGKRRESDKMNDECLFFQLQKQKEKRNLLDQQMNKINSQEFNKESQVKQQAKDKFELVNKKDLSSNLKTMSQNQQNNNQENNQKDLEEGSKDHQLNKDIININEENLKTENILNHYLVTEEDSIQEDRSLSTQQDEYDQNEIQKSQIKELQTSNLEQNEMIEQSSRNYQYSPSHTLISYTPRRKKLNTVQSTFN